MLTLFAIFSIGIAPIVQVTHMRNKNSDIQGRSFNVLNCDFPYYRELLIFRKEFAPSGSKFYPLREVPILKKGCN